MTPLYWIEGPWPGRLAIAPRPRGGDWLSDEIRDWHKVGVDGICRQGVGRSAMLAAALLTLDGTQPRDAWERIASSRGAAVPDTAEQKEWVASLIEGTKRMLPVQRCVNGRGIVRIRCTKGFL